MVPKCYLIRYLMTSDSVCKFQSMKSPVELNSLLLKFFRYGTRSLERWNWRLWKRGLFFKPYCFFETIDQRFKIYKLNCFCSFLSNNQDNTGNRTDNNYISLWKRLRWSTRQSTQNVKCSWLKVIEEYYTIGPYYEIFNVKLLNNVRSWNGNFFFSL